MWHFRRLWASNSSFPTNGPNVTTKMVSTSKVLGMPKLKSLESFPSVTHFLGVQGKIQTLHKNKPERVFGLQVRWSELNIFKILGIYLGIFLEEFFGRNILRGIFWKKFFWRIFLEGFFWEEFLGGILCLHWNWFVCQEERNL